MRLVIKDRMHREVAEIEGFEGAVPREGERVLIPYEGDHPPLQARVTSVSHDLLSRHGRNLIPHDDPAVILVVDL
jgi:hypothetical protein